MEKSPNTISHIKLAREEILTPRYLHDMTPKLLQKYKEHLIQKGGRPHHINSLVMCIKTAMHRGEKWQFAPKQDWSLLSKIKTPRGRIVFHTLEELDKLLKACPSDTWRLVVLLGADARLRRGEIMNLRWDNVDFNNNQLYIAPNKTEYPNTESLRNALQRAKRGRKPFCGPMWACYRNIDSLTACYKKIDEAAGVDSFLHKLRHTFASQLVQNGVELYTVCQLLGHRTIQMTEIYARLAPADLHKTVFNLPKRGMQLVDMEEKAVCEGNKACRQIGVDFGDSVKNRAIKSMFYMRK